MVWFGEIAGSAVKDLLFNWPKDQIDVSISILINFLNHILLILLYFKSV